MEVTLALPSVMYSQVATVQLIQTIHLFKQYVLSECIRAMEH